MPSQKNYSQLLMLSRIVTKRTFQVSPRYFSTARVNLENGSPLKDKEQATENVYIKKHELEQLKKLREKVEKQKETIDKLETQLKETKK